MTCGSPIHLPRSVVHAVHPQMSDFEYVGKVFNTICEEVKDTILSNMHGKQVSQSRGPEAPVCDLPVKQLGHLRPSSPDEEDWVIVTY